jgi:hypothetical protein
MILSLNDLSSDRRFPISEGPICRVYQHSIGKELLMQEKRLPAAACVIKFGIGQKLLAAISTF